MSELGSNTESLIRQVRELEGEVTRLGQEIQRSQEEGERYAQNLRHARAHLIAARESLQAGESTEEILQIVNAGLEVLK